MGEKGSQPRWAGGKAQGTHPILCSPRQQAPKTPKQMEKLSIDRTHTSAVMGAEGRTCESFPTVPASTHPLQLVTSLNEQLNFIAAVAQEPSHLPCSPGLSPEGVSDPLWGFQTQLFSPTLGEQPRNARGRFSHDSIHVKRCKEGNRCGTSLPEEDVVEEKAEEIPLLWLEGLVLHPRQPEADDQDVQGEGEEPGDHEDNSPDVKPGWGGKQRCRQEQPPCPAATFSAGHSIGTAPRWQHNDTTRCRSIL